MAENKGDTITDNCGIARTSALRNKVMKPLRYNISFEVDDKAILGYNRLTTALTERVLHKHRLRYMEIGRLTMNGATYKEGLAPLIGY